MVTLTISRNDLYGFVSTLTALYGRSKENFETYNISPDNYPMLDTLVGSALSEVKKVLAVSYTNKHSIEGDVLTLTLNDDAGLHDENTITLLTEQVRFALAYMLASYWLSAIEEGAGEMYAASAGSYIRDAAAIFAKRNPRETVYQDQRNDDQQVDGETTSSMADADTMHDGDKRLSPAGESSMTDADTSHGGDKRLTPSGESSMTDADTSHGGDQRLTPAGESSMADAETRTADRTRIDTGSSIMDDGDAPLHDNILEKPWCRHRHLLHDKDWKFISTKQE